MLKQCLESGCLDALVAPTVKTEDRIIDLINGFRSEVKSSGTRLVGLTGDQATSDAVIRGSFCMSDQIFSTWAALNSASSRTGRFRGYPHSKHCVQRMVRRHDVCSVPNIYESGTTGASSMPTVSHSQRLNVSNSSITMQYSSNIVVATLAMVLANLTIAVPTPTSELDEIFPRQISCIDPPRCSNKLVDNKVWGAV